MHTEGSAQGAPRVDVDRDTLVSLFRDTVAARGSEPALRIRRGDEVRELSWDEYAARAAGFAAGLRALGIGHGDHVVLMMRNTPDFYVADVGCLLAGAVPVSVYDSPSVERLAFVLDHCEARVVVAEDEVFVTRARRAAADGVQLVGVAPDAQGEGVVSFAELCAASPLDLDTVAQETSREDVAVMLYTSGTSGAPKGVPLRHRNLVHSIDSFTRRGEVDLAGRRQLSYLPMAHIGERFATHYLHLAQGSVVTCCPSMPDVPTTLAETHPHMFFGAPRMWENLHTTVRAHLAGDSDQLVAFDAELDARRAEREAGRDPGPVGEGVIRSVLSRFGLDRIEVSIVGSAPLPRHIQEFWIDCGLPLGDFYGQTETGGMGTWDPTDVTIGTVGRPMPGIEIRISSEGEILSRSATNFDGYFRDAERTAEAFDEDGFFRTGDLGDIDETGNLVVHGRAGDMIVPTSGHNVVPGPLEGALMRSPLVTHACVVGTRRPHVAAVLVVDPAQAREWLDEAGHPPDDSEPGQHPEIRAEIDRLVAGVNSDLPGAERIRSHRIVCETWALDSDVLTATGKMRRKGVAARYQELIDEMYADPGR